ncbi:MAG: hypothetical protein IPN62_04625 [Flavobacteriales bacterium]|jgi:hypothetical protein|nr:hypothetical protein [Flavobacteriales bacterium]HOZ41049.1 hypothetical protein [Flavobacteriales bacterium]
MKQTLFFALVLSSLVISGCKKEEVVATDLGYGYYPTTLGSWVEYQVDSIWKDEEFGEYDSVSYRLRQRIESAFIDAEGRQAWRVQRSVQDTSGTWRVRDVWSTTANGIIAELTEENERRLKLSFPVRLGRAWDSNVFNVNPELEVGYEEVDVAWSVNGLSFDSTALVQNTVPANPVDRRDLVERYAKGIGMVYKQWEETNTQMTGTRGFKVTMVAVDHGTN